jgi:tRNA G10  N-methylase Trm11
MIEMSSPKQANYIFVPGKNWKLSLSELVSYFEARKCDLKITNVSKSFFVISSQETIQPSIVDCLGGIIKIGRVISQIPLRIVEDAFLRREKEAREKIRANLSAENTVSQIFKTFLEKCVFGVSLYFEDSRFLRPSREMQRFFGSYFKEELVALGSKAKFMGFPRSRSAPQLTHVEVLKKKLVEKSAEILLCIDREQALLSNTIAVHNPFEFQKRDINRPLQRKIFSIPPRLASIMVNLSLCLPGKVFLDPFCGVGTILQEAMLTGAQVVGMDKDSWCVRASRTNLDWLSKEYDLSITKYTVLLGDTQRLTDQIGQKKVDCIATEPDLGPALRHIPTEHYAERIVESLKPLYNNFLAEAYMALKNEGTLVFVTPYIKTRSGKFISLRIEEKAIATGFKIIRPFESRFFTNGAPLIKDLEKISSFIDMRKEHKIGREIHVLQK